LLLDDGAAERKEDPFGELDDEVALDHPDGELPGLDQRGELVLEVVEDPAQPRHLRLEPVDAVDRDQQRSLLLLELGDLALEIVLLLLQLGFLVLKLVAQRAELFRLPPYQVLADAQVALRLVERVARAREVGLELALELLT